jgi:hypothetical protein
MTPYTSFLDYVLPDAPGCTNEVALLAIKSTVLDFCEKSLILQRDHEPVTLVRGNIDYDLEPPKDHQVTKIMKVYYKDAPIDAVSPEDITAASMFNRNYPGAQVEEGPPRVYTQKDARTFSIYPFPKDTEKLALTLRVALKPTRSATQCDDLIYEDYAEIIGHGALTRLVLSPNKPYSSPNLAGARNVQYTAGVNLARQRANHGYVRASKQVRLRNM